MNKPIFFAPVLFFISLAYGQENILIFKKGNRDIARFWKGTTISFQLESGQWQKGELTKIQNDSFYIRPMVVRYGLMGTDTIYFSIIGFALSNVFAFPKKGVLIDFINGSFQISTSGGHQHWYWIKSGWVFRVGGAGYAGLNIANAVVNHGFPHSAGRLGIAAAVFLGGVILHKSYKLYLPLGRKYQLKILKLSR